MKTTRGSVLGTGRDGGSAGISGRCPKLVGRLCMLAGRAGGLARRPTSEAVLPPAPGGLGAGRAALPPCVSRSHPADGGEAGE